MQVCNSLQTDNHASTPPLSFLQAGFPSCHPTNSIKALKAQKNRQYNKTKTEWDPKYWFEFISPNSGYYLLQESVGRDSVQYNTSQHVCSETYCSSHNQAFAWPLTNIQTDTDYPNGHVWPHLCDAVYKTLMHKKSQIPCGRLRWLMSAFKRTLK